MALDVNAITPWRTLVEWSQGQPDKPAYQCVKDVEALVEWTTGTDAVSRVWQTFSWAAFRPQAPLTTDDEKFAKLKNMLLMYLEEAPNGHSFSIQQLQSIQIEIENNETLVEMWNCTKKHYLRLAQNGGVPSEFPDYAFGFTYFGSLAERVKKIKVQIDELNRPRSQVFASVSQWFLHGTHLTHAFVPQIIAREFTHIILVDLSNNQFETVGDFSQLGTLKTLVLTNNRLRDIPVAYLPFSLEALDLDRNQFDTQPNLAPLIHLNWLDFSDNRLSAISSRYLPAGLENLSIRNNPLNSIGTVQADLPNLQIEI